MKRSKTRLADYTSGVRLRVDQIEAVGRLCAIDPEMDMSTAVRRGLDMFLATQLEMLASATVTHARRLHSISAALARPAENKVRH